MSGDTNPTILEDLPPKRLLSGDQLKPILAGIRCMNSIETIQAYLAYETTHQDRTHVQDKLRLRARKLRRGDGDE
ncbi:hypothetical protein [Haloarcula amylovorans]|uniref:hypothetical protein n=1 Tax=Haloarcula amylovorans TaxID=2562280 RepID=UPI00107636B7|nr:hypothetical protein [Halomicroarcula amylolytica]